MISVHGSMLFADHLQAGGKEDSYQGVGTNVDKVDEALAVAKDYLSTILDA